MFAFVTPLPTGTPTLRGERVCTEARRNTGVIRASLGDAITKRARADWAKVQNVINDGSMLKGAAVVAVAAAALSVPQPSNALTKSDIDQLSYLQVKGTGLANRCPEVAENGKTIELASGKTYKMVDLCLEPKTFLVEEEVVNKRKNEVTKNFVETKLMTRATYTLTGIEGPLKVDGGNVVFTEKDGIDYAATTVQLPGGERVPFLFTVKDLVAKAEGTNITKSSEFSGDFKVPSYRTGLFLDPKGRGGVTGYDMAVALPGLEADGGEGQDELFKETNKVFQVTDGSIEMAVQRVDKDTGELAGVFVSEQFSDTDMGAKAPKKVLLKGIFYARVDES